MNLKKDPHKALKHEILGQAQSRNLSFTFTKLQWGKDDIGFNVHADPHGFSSYGIQVTDFLNYLGFRSGGECPFVASRRCFNRWVDESFKIADFPQIFDGSYSILVEAQRDLEKCGFFLDQPEGWGHFLGGNSRRVRNESGFYGDGHTGLSKKIMKESEDDIFKFKLTWIETDLHKGWVIHYKPKHQPTSYEIESVFGFLGLDTFEQCPEYDFEPCFWRSISFTSIHENSTVYNWFDAQASQFSSGIRKLLQVNNDIEKVGLTFLPSFLKPKERLDKDIEKLVIRPNTSNLPLAKFDVAISFAGSERPYAEQLATLLKDAGFVVFYDDFYPEYLWGKNLVDTFDEIYQKRSRYCVIFISKEYNDRMWTNHERQSAQARTLKERGKEYILPIKVDNTELTGMPFTVGHVSISDGIEKIAELLIKKLKQNA